MQSARAKIISFRSAYKPYLEVNSKAKTVLGTKIQAIYRDGQDFATKRIALAVEDVLREVATIGETGKIQTGHNGALKK